MSAAWSRALQVPSLVLVVACGTETVFGGRDSVDTAPPGFEDSRSDSDTTPDAVCSALPNPVAPGKRVDFIGEASFDPGGVPIASYRWKLARKPKNSLTTMPVGDANRLGMVPDYVGEYGATLEVVNEKGTISEPCSVGVAVRPTDGLYIEAEATLVDDIQVVLSLNDGAVCAPGSCAGFGGADADPTFLYFNRDKSKLASVGIPAPKPGTYEIAVRDNVDPSNFALGDNPVTVRVFVNGNLKWTGTHTFEKEPGYPDIPVGRIALAKVAMPSGSVQAVAAP